MQQSDLLNPEYFNRDKAELNLTQQNLTDEDVRNSIIPFLNDHPEVKTLNLALNRIGAEGAKAFEETDPRKRANYGREVGLQTEVPSLLRMNLFKVQNMKEEELAQSKFDIALLPEDLKAKLAQPKFNCSVEFLLIKKTI